MGCPAAVARGTNPRVCQQGLDLPRAEDGQEVSHEVGFTELLVGVIHRQGPGRADGHHARAQSS